MMQPSSATSEAGDLRALWCSTARRATDAQLVVCVALALVAAIGFGVGAFVDMRRTSGWWPLMLLALLAGAFGAWGIADRELHDGTPSPTPRRVLEAMRWGAGVAAGVVAALATLGILRFTIGTWIS